MRQLMFTYAAFLKAILDGATFSNGYGHKWCVYIVYTLYRNIFSYVPWSKVPILGMVIPPLIGILIMGI